MIHLQTLRKATMQKILIVPVLVRVVLVGVGLLYPPPPPPPHKPPPPVPQYVVSPNLVNPLKGLGILEKRIPWGKKSRIWWIVFQMLAPLLLPRFLIPCTLSHCLIAILVFFFFSYVFTVYHLLIMCYHHGFWFHVRYHVLSSSFTYFSYCLSSPLNVCPFSLFCIFP